MKNQNEKTSRNAVGRWIMAFGLLGFVVYAIVAAHATKDATTSIVIEVFVFLSTTYASWMISRHFAEQQQLAESRRIGALAGRRVIELYKSVQSLLSSTMIYRDDNVLSQERFIHIASRLEEISFSVRATLGDIKVIAQFKQDDDEELTIPDERQIPGVVLCPNCYAKNYVATPDHAGATLEVKCIECHDQFITHRRADHSIIAKLITRKPRPKSLSIGRRDTSTDEPVVAQRPKETARQDELNSLESVSHIKIACQKCGHHNEYGYRPYFKYIKRSCFNCFDKFCYYINERRFENFGIKEPVLFYNVSQGAEYPYINCSDCNQRIRTDNPTINERNERIVMCFRCGSAHVDMRIFGSEIP